MKLEEIKCEADILAYIRGTLNDFDGTTVSRNDAEWAIIHLISWAVLRDRENRLKLEDINKTEP